MYYLRCYRETKDKRNYFKMKRRCIIKCLLLLYTLLYMKMYFLLYKTMYNKIFVVII